MRSVARRAAVVLLATMVGAALLALTAAGWAFTTTPLQASVLTATVGVVLLALAAVGWSLTAVSARADTEPMPDPDETFKLTFDMRTCTWFAVSRGDPFASPSELAFSNDAELEDRDSSPTRYYPNSRNQAPRARGTNGADTGGWIAERHGPLASRRPPSWPRGTGPATSGSPSRRGFRVELDGSVG